MMLSPWGDSLNSCSGEDLVLPNLTLDDIAKHARFLILSLPNNDMMKKSPFATHKAPIGIGGEPKSIKRLRSGDLLIETSSAVQTKSFFLAKTFLDSPLTISPHKSLNISRGVISEPDLLSTPEAEILDGFSDQGVIQVRRITIKQDATIIPTKHLILTFNSPKLPCTIKAGYLNFPQPSQTCAQITKPTAISTTTQTDPSITKIICPPLQCLSPISSTSSSMPAASTSSSSAQIHLLPSTSAEIPTIQSKSLLSIPIPTTIPNNNLNTSASSLETEIRPLTFSNKFTALQPSVPLSESATITPNSEYSNTSKVPQNVKQILKNRRKCTKSRNRSKNGKT
ncbi:uncharacterized protein TNCV_3859641 [Trichonephila clavipes]|nr:uncharacterized protein TNCV_3859641 [Trichonephila clavipes]